MTRRRPLSRPPSRRSPRRPRGVFFVQIMAALFITAIVLTAASTLLSRAWKSHRAAVATADRATVFEQVTNALRRDVTAAGRVAIDGNTLTLGDGISWSAEGQRLHRLDAAGSRTFDLVVAVAFVPSPGGVRMQWTEPDGRTAAIPFVSGVAWAREVLR